MSPATYWVLIWCQPTASAPSVSGGYCLAVVQLYQLVAVQSHAWSKEVVQLFLKGEQGKETVVSDISQKVLKQLLSTSIVLNEECLTWLCLCGCLSTFKQVNLLSCFPNQTPAVAVPAWKSLVQGQLGIPCTNKTSLFTLWQKKNRCWPLHFFCKLKQPLCKYTQQTFSMPSSSLKQSSTQSSDLLHDGQWQSFSKHLSTLCTLFFLTNLHSAVVKLSGGADCWSSVFVDVLTSPFELCDAWLQVVDVCICTLCSWEKGSDRAMQELSQECNTHVRTPSKLFPIR